MCNLSSVSSVSDVISNIASTKLRIKSLDTQGSDSADFHELSVWAIKAALEAAYEAGKASK